MQKSSGFYKVMERETPRVKSAAFHPRKPVVIIAQHTGVIQAYEYQLNLLVHEFLDHVGPVRSIVYHPLLDIFASGGDDIKIRIWDYYTKRIIVVFEGHRDYVRSLDFHPHQPYLLSTSDDQTIRVWNFQSKVLLATLPGHIHYVMCGKFFLDDYIVSGSLDQTIRIWDYKNINHRKNSILSLPNVYVRQILDGHSKGINNIAVHKNTFATVSDDREVKLWEFDGISVHEKEVFYHHQNIVSSVWIDQDHLISNGEDGIVVVYSFNKRKTRKFQIDSRFWCVSSARGLYCVGHDAGFYVFSLEDTRRVFRYEDGLYYVKNKTVFFNDFGTEEKVFSSSKRIVSLHKEPGRDRLLVQYESQFEVLQGGLSLFIKTGTGLLCGDRVVVMADCALFALDASGNQTGERVESSYERVFGGPSLLAAIRGSTIFLLSMDYNVLATKILNFEILDMAVSEERVAAFNRNNVVLLDHELNIVSSAHELAPINSGFFSEEVFFYSTIRQIKFLGKCAGILKSLEDAFVFHRDGNTIYYLRDEIGSVTIDLTEFDFKNAIMRDVVAGSPEERERNEFVKSIIESGDLPGLAPMSFLLRNKRGDIALPYITDPKQKFKLCLSNRMYRESLEICKEIGDKGFFRKLASESLTNCCPEVAEECFEYLGDSHSLFLLYLCTKRRDKIEDLCMRAPTRIKIEIARYLGRKNLILEFLEDRGCISREGDSTSAGKPEDLCPEQTLPLHSGDTASAVTEDSMPVLPYDSKALGKKKEAIESGLDCEAEYRRAMNATTQGRFDDALASFRNVLYLKIDDEATRKSVGAYISGLSVEKKRRTIRDPQKNVEMALYFCSLPLEKEHKVLATKKAVRVLQRYENFANAAKIARDAALEPEELAGEGNTNKYEVRGGIFCYDILEYRNAGIQCGVCYAHSSTGGICRCCEVGILQ